MSNFEVENHADKSKDEDASLLKRLSGKMIYRVIFGTVLGAVGGFLYWYFIGCTGGSCPLTSDPYKTTGLFALFGGWYSYRK